MLGHKEMSPWDQETMPGLGVPGWKALLVY